MNKFEVPEKLKDLDNDLVKIKIVSLDIGIIELFFFFLKCLIALTPLAFLVYFVLTAIY